MSTGSIEEKIIQRQLSKEGLADIVDDKEQVSILRNGKCRSTSLHEPSSAKL